MIRLGQLVKDKISGFQGYITCMSEQLSGTLQFGIQPKVDPTKNELPECKYIDDFMLEVLDDGYADSLPPVDTSVTIKLGDDVRDTISGLRGTVIDKITFMNGCVFFQIIGKWDTANKEKPPSRFTSHKLIERLTVPAATAKRPETSDRLPEPAAKRTGGPNRSVQSIR